MKVPSDGVASRDEAPPWRQDKIHYRTERIEASENALVYQSNTPRVVRLLLIRYGLSGVLSTGMEDGRDTGPSSTPTNAFLADGCDNRNGLDSMRLNY